MVAQCIRGKEANGFKPNVYRGEKDGETFTAFRMELQSWAGAVHDSMLQVLETAEAEQGRIDEANVSNGGLNQETVDDFKEMDRRMYQLLVVCRKGTAKNYVCVPGRSGFKRVEADGQSLRPKNRCRQICAVLESDTPSEHAWADINKAEDTARREKHTAGMGQED